MTGSTDYDAFGAVHAQTGSSLALGYTGALTDPTTGFVDLRARDLDPALGRFLSADTVSPNADGSQGYNLYAYVANNPTTWTDPSGHDPVDVLAAFAVGAELLSGLALAPEAAGLVGLVVTFVVVGIIFLGVAAILDCVATAACRDRFVQNMETIGQYGSGAAAGAWTLSGPATRLAWQQFPGLLPDSVCALGAVEGIATNSVVSAIGGQRSTVRDTTFAAAMGCASGGSGGGGGGSSGDSQSGKTQWGWRGSPEWKQAVKIVREAATRGSADVLEINGKVPTEAEARALIKDAGGIVLRAEEHPVGGVSTHTYPHINYYIGSSKVRATIRILSLGN